MVRVRFAPSPTGYLHLGNVRTALFNYLFAKRQGGQFILRVEDTDRERSKDEYRRGLMEDLLWMGLRWDEGPEVGGSCGPYVQSERMEIYRQHVEKLIRDGKAYECYVTEEETAKMKALAKLEKRPPRFDNRGRFFSAEQIAERKTQGIRPTVRFKIDSPLLSLTDLVRGEVHFNLDDMMGDFVIQRADGMPTFHLGVCVDDALMKITHVIRGEDHLSNTPKHILLLRAMGYEPPQYGHLSLVNGPGGEPLSKRMESISVREFRRRGYLPYALANYIALLGWSPGENREILSWSELQSLFDLSRVSRSSSNYDPDKLDWLNGEHLRLLPDEEFVRRAAAYLHTLKLPYPEPDVLKLLPIFKDNIKRFEELPERLKVLEDPADYENPAAWIAPAEAKGVFEQSLGVLREGGAGLEEADLHYDAFIEKLKGRVKSKGKNLFMPLRVALTGCEHGPELKRLFSLLGKVRLEKRFRRAFEATL